MPISALHQAPDPRPPALAVRLNTELLASLRQARRQNYTPKLVVRDGRFALKISDTVSFPCSAAPETLRFDIYSPASSTANDYSFTGTVTSRLNVLTDAKQIKEHLRTHAPAAASPAPGPASGASPQNPPELSVASDAYAVRPTDSKPDVFAKFVALLALGPATRPAIDAALDPHRLLAESHVSALIAAHAQPYSSHDPLIEGDTYPLVASGRLHLSAAETHYVLKDKTYKELRPWQWQAYTTFERTHIVHNTNNALTRMGFSDSHPLRRLIVDQTSPQKPKKAGTLGGGILSKKHGRTLSQAASPVPASPAPAAALKRPHTVSPRLDSAAQTREKRAKVDSSPLKEDVEKGNSPTKDKNITKKNITKEIVKNIVKEKNIPVKMEKLKSTYALLSGSSSEDEKWNEKSKRTNSNGSTHSTASASSNHHSVTSDGTASTSPSSVNDDGSEPSDEDKAPTKVASLPSRPGSSITGGDKKQHYYMQLAEKFRAKYTEYARLHSQLSRERKGSSGEKKKSLSRLYELHTLLAEWKRKLWDYHNENYMAEEVMSLSKHRKAHASPRIEKPKEPKERAATPRRTLDY